MGYRPKSRPQTTRPKSKAAQIRHTSAKRRTVKYSQAMRSSKNSTKTKKQRKIANHQKSLSPPEEVLYNIDSNGKRIDVMDINEEGNVDDKVNAIIEKIVGISKATSDLKEREKILNNTSVKIEGKLISLKQFLDYINAEQFQRQQQ